MGNITRRPLALILIAAALATPSLAQRRPVPANVPAADWMTTAPQTFSVVLQVERDTTRSDRGINSQVAAAVCRSTAVVDPSLEAAFKMPAADARPLVTVDAQPTSDAFLTLTVTINDPQKRLPDDAGSKLVDELARRTTAALTKSAELQIAPLKARRLELAQRLDEATAQAAAMDAEYARAAPMFEAMNNGMRSGTSRPELERQRAMYVAQLAGYRARLAAIEEGNRAASRPAEGSVEGPTSMPVDYAIELVKIRERRLATVNRDDSAALSAAYADLAEAQLMARLVSLLPPTPYLRVQSQFSPANAASLRAQIAEAEAQLASVEAQLALFGPATTQATMTPTDFNQLQNDRNEARSRVRQARQELEQFDRQNGAIRPPSIVPLTGER